MEIWWTSNIRPLRIGEEKKEERRRNHRGKIVCLHLLRRVAIIKEKTLELSSTV